MTVAHQLHQLALAHHRIVDVETGELDLLRVMNFQRLAEPVVQRAVNLELQGANGVGDTLDGVALAVGVVVHRVDAPLVAGAVVMAVQDAVHDGVAHVHVGRGHADFCTQHLAPVGELAGLHAAEEVKVLLDAAVAVRTFDAGFRGHATARTDLLLRLVIDVGEAVHNELLGPLVELVEVVGGIMLLGPLKTEPCDIFFDGVHVLHIFLDRVGVIEAEVAETVIFLGDSEVQTDGLGVADMQVAVRFRRETGVNFRSVFSVSQVSLNDFFNKIHSAIGFDLRLNFSQLCVWKAAAKVRFFLFHIIKKG